MLSFLDIESIFRASSSHVPYPQLTDSSHGGITIGQPLGAGTGPAPDRCLEPAARDHQKGRRWRVVVQHEQRWTRVCAVGVQEADEFYLDWMAR